MQTEKIDLKQALPIIRNVLSAGGVFTFYPHGTSMLPTIKAGRDSVGLVSPDTVTCGDIALYERDDGALILHRVVKITASGFDICGDNQPVAEKNIPSNRIIAVVSEYTNGQKNIKRGDKTFKKQYIAVALSRPFKRLYRHIIYRIKKH